MVYWQILAIIGISFLIIEIFTPMMFFLNFSLACFCTAILSLYTKNLNILIPFFVVLSILFVSFLRPILMKKLKNKNYSTGVEEKYIGKTAKVIEDISKNSGAISIYDERWNARTLTDETFKVGEEVKIIKNESLIFYVEKI